MKKTLTIIGLSFIALLAVVTIVLAFVQSSFAQAYNFDVNPLTIEVHNASGESNSYSNVSGALEEQTTAYNKLLSLYKSSSKESVLTALLQGAYSFSPEVTESYVSGTNIDSKLSSNVCMRIYFSTAQTLKVNGKEYKDSNDKTVSYNGLVVMVNDSTNLTEYTIYTIQNITSSTNYKSTHQVTAIGKQADLYSYITNDLDLR